MIKKMSKYSFIVLLSELDSFLESLQGLGIVDITRSTKAMDAHSKEVMSLSKRYSNAIKSLENIKEAEPIHKQIPRETLLTKVEETIYRGAELKSLLVSKAREYQESIAWGDFSNEDITKIKDLGLVPKFYTSSEKKFREAWKSEHSLQVLNTINGKVYFTILHPKEEQSKFDLPEIKFPEVPYTAIEKEIVSINTEIKEVDQKMSGFVKYIEELEKQRNELLSELDHYFANIATTRQAEDSIAILEGFAPIEDDTKIVDFLEKAEVLYLKDKASAEDNPPIKLKNNFFTRVFEPIGEFYVLPRYDELDLTPYFAPFYMLFFGFCLGDMGYGLLLLIAGVIAILKFPKFKDYGKLLAFLGIGTIIMPALTGTFFGMKIYNIIDFPESIDNFFFSDMKLFWFGIIFGLVQIVFARMLKAVYCILHKKWDNALTDIGWTMLIVCGSFSYAGMEMDKIFLPKIVNSILLYGGLFFVVFFSSPSKNILFRLKGIASLYDVTSIFGDMLSYIRLFGLATAGGILGMVVNSVAMDMTSIPYLGWVFAVLMLIVGHAMVLVLSALGAFVHPMRLTFVEFYKNASFTGGGRAFNPLKRNNK